MGRCRWHRLGRPWPLEVPAAPLLHGAVSLEEGPDGWVRPLRFYPSQLRALASCAAWHPALYRSQARTTSGVVVEFLTDASEAALQVDVDPEPRGTTAQIELAEGGPSRDPFDGVSATVDGHHLGPCMPPTGPCELVVDLDDGVDEPTLPGLDPCRHVRLWLPCLRGCRVRQVACDGTFVRPVAPRPSLLVLGDSIAQGFLVGDPALTWPALVASEAGLDLVNQGVGGLVFQPTALMGLGALAAPAAVWVALGANYRFEGWNPGLVAREVSAYLDAVEGLWPDVPVFVATPTPHDEAAYPTHRGAAYATVPAMIAAAAQGRPRLTLVDGTDLLEDRSRYFADADHPSTRGARLMALRSGRVLRGEPPIDTMAAKAARRAALDAAGPGRGSAPAADEPPPPPPGTDPLPLEGVGAAGDGPLEAIAPAPVTGTRKTTGMTPLEGGGTMGIGHGPRGAGEAARAGRDLELRFNALAHGLPDDDAAGREAGQAYLAGTHALYHGSPLSWAFTPKVFTGEGVGLLRDAAETMYRIMVKVTRAYAQDPAVRAAFALPAEVERLSCIDTHYPEPIPIARVDVFFNEDTGDFWFCELNTDGSSGLTATEEVTRAVAASGTWAALDAEAGPLGSFPVVDACARAVLDTYASWDRAGTGPFPAERPSVAVVDYLESLSRDEVDDFVERFAAMGVEARVADIRDLSVEEVDGAWRLVDGSGPVDCVWRRVVLSEMEAKPCDGADALVLAAEENLACLVGGFSTWPCATKTVFAFLHSPAAASVLDADELAFVADHVPYTHVLSPDDDLSRYRDREAWILKPADGYNSAGVLAGQDADGPEWDRALAEGAASGAVVQAYAPQYRCPVIVGGCAPDDATSVSGTVEASCMEGLYLFGGRFSGVFTRCGTEATIGEWTSRLNMGCFFTGPGPDGPRP